jgi:hypothetical protein
MLYQIKNTCKNPLNLDGFKVTGSQQKVASEIWQSCSTGKFRRTEVDASETYKRPAPARLIKVKAAGESIWWVDAEPGSELVLSHPSFPTVQVRFTV